MPLSGHILILTGPPGSGKTTTAAALASSSDVAAVHLHADNFWRSIKSGFIPPYLPEAHAQNTTVMDVVAGTADAYARGNFFVVVDGIIGPWFLAPFRALAAPLHYVVLRPSLDDAIARCRQRGGDTLTDPGAITGLHRQFGSLGELERHVIETAGQSRADTQAAVQAALHDDRFALGNVTPQAPQGYRIQD